MLGDCCGYLLVAAGVINYVFAFVINYAFVVAFLWPVLSARMSSRSCPRSRNAEMFCRKITMPILQVSMNSNFNKIKCIGLLQTCKRVNGSLFGIQLLSLAIDPQYSIQVLQKLLPTFYFVTLWS